MGKKRSKKKNEEERKIAEHKPGQAGRHCQHFFCPMLWKGFKAVKVRPAPPRMSCQATRQPGWEPASQPYQEQEADVALATVSVSLFRVSLRLACSHSNWRRQDTDPDPDPHWDIPYDIPRRDPVSYFDSDCGMFQFVMLAIYHVCNCLSPDLIRSNESRVTSARGVWASVSGFSWASGV